MNLADPISGIVPGVRGRVLAALIESSSPLSGREIARRARASQRGAAQVLADLVVHGLVSADAAPPSILYRLNRDHLLAPAVAALTDVRTRLVARVRSVVEAWEVQAVGVTLFGSMARSEGGTGSDIDLLLVRPDGVAPDDDPWVGQLTDLHIAVSRWTGNSCSLIEFGETELCDAARDHLPLADDVMDDGTVIAGRAVSELTRVARVG